MMVCSDCKIGGELNTIGLALRETGNSEKAEESFTAAERRHEQCRGCDCQHIVGTWMHWPHVDVAGRPE